MRIVIAIGGNALLLRGQPLEIDNQRCNIKNACASIAQIAEQHEVIVTHGNGPQIGLIALQAAAYKQVTTYPLDVLGAESQGMIGYLLAQELKNQLPDQKIAVILTQVMVAPDDPAFNKPTKFIGPIYTKEEAQHLVEKCQWNFAKDGNHLRRVVPSPLPQEIVEIATIRALVNDKTLVICTGGGGIPIIRDSKNHYSGVEAVIDKDFATALLAEQLNADCLLLLTDVANVIASWGEPGERPIDIIKRQEIETLSFACGSMGPKVAAACQFVKNTSKIAHIGLLTDAIHIVQHKAGTTIVP